MDDARINADVTTRNMESIIDFLVTNNIDLNRCIKL
jgi:hypothetical protein